MHRPFSTATASQQHAIYDLLNLHAGLFEPAELRAEYGLVLTYSKHGAQFALQELTTTVKRRARRL